MLPLKQKLIVPRSSLTTTTTASVSSVMPSAARWREPSDLSRILVSGIGKNTPAFAIRRLRMTTAPSWSLFRLSGTKEADEELALHRRVDGRALADHELVEVRVLLEGDERADAVARELGRGGTTSSMTRDSCCRDSPARKARAPTRMSPRRMSFWKTTTTMRMIGESSVRAG